MESTKRESVSILTNVFTANLIQSDARLTKPEFTAVARQFVCLPPVSNGESKLHESKCGCTIEHCRKRTCKAGSEVLDAAGNHGLLCNPGVRRRELLYSRELYKIPFGVQDVILRDNLRHIRCWAKYFQKLICRSCSPGKLSATESDKRKKLSLQYLDIINEMPRVALNAERAISRCSG